MRAMLVAALVALIIVCLAIACASPKPGVVVVPIRTECATTTQHGRALVLDARHVATVAHNVRCVDGSAPMIIQAAGAEMTPDGEPSGNFLRLVAVGIVEPWRGVRPPVFAEARHGMSGTPALTPDGKVLGLIDSLIPELSVRLAIDAVKSLQRGAEASELLDESTMQGEP